MVLGGSVRKRDAGSNPVETIARYIETESQCLMEIVVSETKHDYGVRLLKTMSNELRDVFGSRPESGQEVPCNTK